ncbi:MAG: Thiamine transporter protein (Thia_YuaJ) [Tenericutes bacterium ADurb.Bin087]|nr:MAG: Thiamine transporter protein (Thia_YuaJ) [Tenericutes bacterium ADurb.Bin087]
MEENKKRFTGRVVWNELFGRILTVRGITEMAVLIAIAIIFDQPFLKIRIGEAASFSLTMLPLLLIALRFPLIDAFLGIGGIYGFITMLMDGYGIITYPLDYLLAYGSLSLVALFQGLVYKKHRNEITNYLFLALAVIAGVSGRIFFSTLSGVIVYETAFGASFVYNAVPMSVSGAICIALLVMLFPTLLRFKPQITNIEIIEQ